MKETIVTIPINDLFAPKCGCPLCRMEEMLEEQYVTFITGDAMMEPSVRVATNKKGFCHRHFSRMTQLGQKLPNALILETHLEVIRDELMPKKLGGKPDKKKLEAIRQTMNSCYVCDRVEADMFHLVATVFAEWSKGGEFRKTYSEQPFICLKHYQFIMTAAMGKGGVPSKLLGDFHADAARTGAPRPTLSSAASSSSPARSRPSRKNQSKNLISSRTPPSSLEGMTLSAALRQAGVALLTAAPKPASASISASLSALPAAAVFFMSISSSPQSLFSAFALVAVPFISSTKFFDDEVM